MVEITMCSKMTCSPPVLHFLYGSWWFGVGTGCSPSASFSFSLGILKRHFVVLMGLWFLFSSFLQQELYCYIVLFVFHHHFIILYHVFFLFCFLKYRNSYFPMLVEKHFNFRHVRRISLYVFFRHTNEIQKLYQKYSKSYQFLYDSILFNMYIYCCSMCKNNINSIFINQTEY